jgi:O-antigen/teichoic acid export membrane protein
VAASPADAADAGARLVFSEPPAVQEALIDPSNGRHLPQHISALFRNLAIYGVGDVATSLISLLLLPVFVRYLTPEDYGVITMLLSIEAITKVAFRWGVDTAFMRLYYDCDDDRSRQRLASTIAFFLLAVNGSILVGALASAPWLTWHLIGPAQSWILVALTLVNTFVAGFFFIPFQVLRIGGRSREFISISFSRSAGTVVARLVLVIWAGLGVLGIVLADVMVTAALAVVMTRWFGPLIRPVFSRSVLREALAFGLPRVPHSVAHQIIGFADRYFLKFYRGLSDVGLYSIGATFGLALKLFLSAFETAWTPFFLGVMHDPDARRIYSTTSTYIVAALVLLVAGLCALAPDVVRLFTTPEYHEAARVTPWIALGVMCQGLYLVGSIGLVITKRTAFYPLATGLAAGASLLANMTLVPRFGIVGAAWANLVAYATLAIATSTFSWRVYPIPYEWSRLLRVAVAGAFGYSTAVWAVPEAVAPVAGLLLRGLATVSVYLGVLYVTGFFHAGELKALWSLRARTSQRSAIRVADPGSTDVEMAGEIISTASEPPADPFPDDPAPGAPPRVSPGSRDPDR